VSEENKAMVRRLVEAINAAEEEAAVDELFAPRAARRVKRLFAEFRKAFPDWREEALQLVSEGDVVAGRFRCSGTHLGSSWAKPPRASACGWKRCSSCGPRGGDSWTTGRWRTAWTGCASSDFSLRTVAGRVEPRRVARAYRTYSAEYGIGAT
jgi:SnoaL-like polyketide cyclase